MLSLKLPSPPPFPFQASPWVSSWPPPSPPGRAPAPARGRARRSGKSRTLEQHVNFLHLQRGKLLLFDCTFFPFRRHSLPPELLPLLRLAEVGQHEVVQPKTINFAQKIYKNVYFFEENNIKPHLFLSSPSMNSLKAARTGDSSSLSASYLHIEYALSGNSKCAKKF